jgi:hypothetical protein
MKMNKDEACGAPSNDPASPVRAYITSYLTSKIELEKEAIAWRKR